MSEKLDLDKVSASLFSLLAEVGDDVAVSVTLDSALTVGDMRKMIAAYNKVNHTSLVVRNNGIALYQEKGQVEFRGWINVNIGRPTVLDRMDEDDEKSGDT